MICQVAIVFAAAAALCHAGGVRSGYFHEDYSKRSSHRDPYIYSERSSIKLGRSSTDGYGGYYSHQKPYIYTGRTSAPIAATSGEYRRFRGRSLFPSDITYNSRRLRYWPLDNGYTDIPDYISSSSIRHSRPEVYRGVSDPYYGGEINLNPVGGERILNDDIWMSGADGGIEQPVQTLSAAEISGIGTSRIGRGDILTERRAEIIGDDRPVIQPTEILRDDRANIQPRAMQIFVRIISTGNIISLDVQPTDTIAAVKAMIENREGISRFQQSLSFEGLPLQNNMILAESGIRQESTLILGQSRADSISDRRISIPGIIDDGGLIGNGRSIITGSSSGIIDDRGLIGNERSIISGSSSGSASAFDDISMTGASGFSRIIPSGSYWERPGSVEYRQTHSRSPLYRSQPINTGFSRGFSIYNSDPYCSSLDFGCYSNIPVYKRRSRSTYSPRHIRYTSRSQPSVVG